MDNSIDEFVMGAGKTIEIRHKGQRPYSVRDLRSRGVPLGKVVDVVSKDEHWRQV